MDIEASEYSTLETMYKEKSLRNVKQILIEVHLTTMADVQRYQTIQRLEELGFRRFAVHFNHMNRFMTSSGRRLSRGYELSYININFLRQE